MINCDYWETRYHLLCKKLSSMFNPMTSNICLICKYYGPYNINMRLDRVVVEGAKLHMGCTIPTGKCLFEPDEDKLNEKP